jgi:hypothetical protein
MISEKLTSDELYDYSLRIRMMLAKRLVPVSGAHQDFIAAHQIKIEFLRSIDSFGYVLRLTYRYGITLPHLVYGMFSIDVLGEFDSFTADYVAKEFKKGIVRGMTGRAVRKARWIERYPHYLSERFNIYAGDDEFYILRR